MTLETISRAALALPEPERRILAGRLHHSLRTGRRMDGWTEAELAHLRGGLTGPEIAARLGRSLRAVYKQRERLRKQTKGE